MTAVSIIMTSYDRTEFVGAASGAVSAPTSAADRERPAIDDGSADAPVCRLREDGR